MTDGTDKTGVPVAVRVTDKGDAYGIYIDGADRWAGATFFLDQGEDRIFYHTEVGEEYGGRGLAGVLVDNALAATRKQNKTVVPVCPYVKSWIDKKQWAGAVRQPTDVDLAAVKAQTSGGKA